MTRHPSEHQPTSRACGNHPNPLTEERGLTADRTASTEGATEEESGRHVHRDIVLRIGNRRLTRGGTLAVVTDREAIEELSGLFLFLADNDFPEYSPIYERLARSIAADRDLLEFIEVSAHPNARRGRVPVLFFASTHDRVLADPDSEIAAIYRGESDADPMPPFLALLDRERSAVVTNMRTRSVQTNEVGRSAALAPGLGAVEHADRDIAIVELGPSAGLNLFVDRWHIDYLRDGRPVGSVGPAGSPVQLHCDLRGPLDPPPFTLGPIARRTGVDPAPIDATDPDQARWLQACIWPGVAERRERLAAALSVAAADPPLLVQGDAVTDLAPLVDSIDPRQIPVVVSTWALAYISSEGRESIFADLDAIGSTRDLAIVTLEEPRFTPWIAAPDDVATRCHETGEGTPTVLGLRQWIGGACTSTLLSLCHPHVRWMRWLDGGSNDG